MKILAQQMPRKPPQHLLRVGGEEAPRSNPKDAITDVEGVEPAQVITPSPDSHGFSISTQLISETGFGLLVRCH